MAGLCIGQNILSQRKLSLGLLLSGIFALSPVFAQAQPASTEKKDEPIGIQLFGKLSPDTNKGEYTAIADALELLKTGKVDEGRAKLAEAAKKNPGLPPASMMLARILFAANQVPAGRAELEKCVLDSPKDPDAYLYLADIAVQQQEITGADLLFREAEKVAADYKGNAERAKDFQIRVNAGSAAIHESREQWKEALVKLQAWAAADPKAATCQQRLAGVMVHMGQFPEAAAALKIAAANEKTMINQDAVLGIMCQQASLRYAGENKDDRSKKKADFLKAEAKARMKAAFDAVNADKAAENKEKNLRCLLAIADFDLVTDQIAHAKEVSEAALKLDSKSVEAKIQRGIVARFQKDTDTAEKFLTEAVSLSPANFMASNHLAIVLGELDRTKEPAKFNRSIEYATSNARQYPKSPEAAATLGWVLYRGGDRLNAGKALEAAASSGSLSADSAYYAAVILADIGKTADAVRLLEAADKTTVPFFHRDEAKDLKAQLDAAAKKKS